MLLYTTKYEDYLFRCLFSTVVQRWFAQAIVNNGLVYCPQKNKTNKFSRQTLSQSMRTKKPLLCLLGFPTQKTIVTKYMDLLADTTSFYCLVNFLIDHSVFLISMMACKITFSRKDVLEAIVNTFIKYFLKKAKPELTYFAAYL